MGGWLPNGGALMAYEVGYLLARKLDAPLYVVRVRDETAPSANFQYSGTAQLIDDKAFLAQCAPDDILVLNPSFHYRLWSLACPARILTYAQHFATFQFLDPGAERYVCASHHIRDHLRKNYGIGARVIWPFVPEGMPAPMPWSEKDDRIVVNFKGAPAVTREILDFLYANGVRKNELVMLKPGLRADLLKTINRSRWFFTPTVTEGFGIIPLEAMALGSIVIGLDGFGGRDYFTTRNSRVVPLREIRELPSILAERGAISGPEDIAEAAKATALAYSRARFHRDWSEELDVFLSGDRLA
jgi:hypothetical protein